ncbi:oxygen-insensitive NAD(P)H nitroreductase [Ancylomarina sp. 16SWW S1-10-2]|uniref:oxygen-insensitive NAD(P)H nitroreductase n=1 Tax=Ancylomarina sp. 16SWW S1-10-2 TaxID=2499681 RepID=UPI0012AD99B6|nr:oxygen-insensitive NAD(P)H nitroreductase [Ancylomarina sp. 16SWW S1-10-2]MRT92418.1 oxygen-insensitive NAD(P)H nitroreductase [Ancylomarina sp. 16SWW S1-10-2]
MNLIDVLNKRYTVKEFDASKTISDEDFEQVKALLRLSPSSVNLQPWHFIIANTKEGKERIAKGTEGAFKFNTPKVLDASHVIVFATRVDADEKYMKSILEQEDKDGRFAEQEFKDQMFGGRMMFADFHRYDLKDLPHWMEKQVYLNMGSLLLGAAALGIDACPMEGVDVKALDEEFGLREKGYTALAMVSLGYRKETDFNAALPKSRFPEEEIITLL